MIENLYKDKMLKKWNDHDGVGCILAHRILKHMAHRKIDFIDIAIIPPASSIGLHRHEDNEETYVVLRGQGVMFCGKDKISVSEGDIIPNPCYGEHGLVNNSQEDILLLVFQTSSKELKKEGEPT